MNYDELKKAAEMYVFGRYSPTILALLAEREKLLKVAEAAKEIHRGRLKEDCYPALRDALKELDK